MKETTMQYLPTDYDDLNAEQALSEIDAYERDLAAGKIPEPCSDERS